MFLKKIQLPIILSCILLSLQYQLWWGPHSISEFLRIQALITHQNIQNQKISQKNNELLEKAIQFKKNAFETVEQYAREDLGMIRSDEQFYWMPKAAL